MNELTLEREQFIARPPAEVFAFHADARNLERLTPPWLRFEIVTPPPVDMREGTLIDYRIRLRGVPVRWRSRIAVWEPPHRFVDEQVFGPYRYWIHTHAFVGAGGGTLVRDHVRFAVPGGALVYRLFVARDLERIFAYRRRQLDVVFS